MKILYTTVFSEENRKGFCLNWNGISKIYVIIKLWVLMKI